MPREQRPLIGDERPGIAPEIHDTRPQRDDEGQGGGEPALQAARRADAEQRSHQEGQVEARCVRTGASKFVWPRR
jgi:hypothetical protein